MITHKLIITNPLGIHAAYAGKLARFAQSRDSSIFLRKGGRPVSAKDMIAVLSLLIKPHDELEILVDGSDEVKDLHDFLELITNLDK